MSTAAAVRARLVHRALVERNTPAAIDAYGDQGTPNWVEHNAAMPCWLYYAPQGRIAYGDPRAAPVLEQPMMLVRKGENILERDRIQGVRDRQGNVIYLGVLVVVSVRPVHNHTELTLESVS